MTTQPTYDNYEIHGCIERPSGPGHESYAEQCPDDEAQYWTLYGHIPGEGVQAIGDFATRWQAEEVYYRITGQPFGSHEANAARVRKMQTNPKLQEALEAGHSKSWVHNAAITQDIEALRAIALEQADWWNNIAWPLIETLKRRAA